MASIVSRLRQFVIRLEQPGMYDDLADLAHFRSRLERRKVPMTELAREAIAEYITRQKKKYGIA